MCRANAIVAVKRAGHLGSTFSALDVVVHLLFGAEHGRTWWTHPDRDVFFTSKGHDGQAVRGAARARPGAVGAPARTPAARGPRRPSRHRGARSRGELRLSRHGHLKGPRGWRAKRHLGRGGRVVVMTGDGELQGGPELGGAPGCSTAASRQPVGDCRLNQVQSDRPTEEIVALDDLSEKFRAFRWHVATCDGHDHAALRTVFHSFAAGAPDPPKLLIAETIKGRGVCSWSTRGRSPTVKGPIAGIAGAPDDDAFTTAHAELARRIGERRRLTRARPTPHGAGRAAGPEPRRVARRRAGVGARFRLAPRPPRGVRRRRVRHGASRASPSSSPASSCSTRISPSDCRIRGFELTNADRFLEVGIAEQDMVSTAAGLALQGLLPVVNSFASFPPRAPMSRSTTR